MNVDRFVAVLSVVFAGAAIAFAAHEYNSATEHNSKIALLEAKAPIIAWKVRICDEATFAFSQLSKYKSVKDANPKGVSQGKLQHKAANRLVSGQIFAAHGEEISQMADDFMSLWAAADVNNIEARITSAKKFGSECMKSIEKTLSP